MRHGVCNKCGWVAELSPRGKCVMCEYQAALEVGKELEEVNFILEGLRK